MRRSILAVAVAVLTSGTLAGSGFAQPPAAQARWDAAQRRYQAETDLYYAERDRYYATRHGGGYGRYGAGYDAPPPPPPIGDDRDEGGYDAARYYRGGSYPERTLASDDRVYAGSDGRYYCRRSDGTTGLIAGAAGGGVLGNVIDGGHSRAAGTLIGAAVGALAGRAIDQNQSQIRCR